jgi:hypothetical protein
MEDGSSGAAILAFMFMIGIMVFYAAVAWKINEKAGEPGWGALVPIYNLYLHLMIADKPGWWLILYFVPFANIVVEIIVTIEMAKKFGKSTAFGVGMILLSFIFYPILAFGDAEYQGNVRNPARLHDGTEAYSTGPGGN